MTEIAFENGQVSNFEGLMTFTLDWVVLQTVVHHSSTSTYTPNFIEIEETFCGQTDVRTYVWTDRCTNRETFEIGFIRKSLPKNVAKKPNV